MNEVSRAPQTPDAHMESLLAIWDRRNEFFDFTDQVRPKGNTEQIKNALNDSLVNTLKFIANETSTIFSARLSPKTKITCSTNIKIIGKFSSDKLQYFTHVRCKFVNKKDTETERDWNSIDQPILLEDNSIFVDILSLWPRFDYFLSNDLRDYYLSRDRENPRPNWEKFYNAAIIVPICLSYERLAHREEDELIGSLKAFLRPTIFGLLSVDCVRNLEDKSTKFLLDRDIPALRKIAREIAFCYLRYADVVSVVNPDWPAVWADLVYNIPNAAAPKRR